MLEDRCELVEPFMKCPLVVGCAGEEEGGTSTDELDEGGLV